MRLNWTSGQGKERSLVASILLTLFGSLSASAEGKRVVEVTFTPTARAQYVVWVENEAGEFLTTIALTESVARRGIGNRPGALQMNGGFRWPYGRREGVLPVWAHRRDGAAQAKSFKRVIFQNRRSEGFASRTSADASSEDYFCLSFDRTRSSRAALDAVSCATPFSSDKGRFITEGDSGYAEPFTQKEGGNIMRDLSLNSLYPPRRDLSKMRGDDHPDSALFASHALEVMPELDAVSKATPADGTLERILFSVPESWPEGNYKVFVEVNTEGDYNEHYNDKIYPTPTGDSWDVWAKTYGYPYRGQPSLVFEVPISLDSKGDNAFVAEPVGRGDIHGSTGELLLMDETISNDPSSAKGSGSDRLYLNDGKRVIVSALARGVCEGDNPPKKCEQQCEGDASCGQGFVCGDKKLCVGLCDADRKPGAPTGFIASLVDDERNAHRWADLSFRIPQATRSIIKYEVRVSEKPIIDEASYEAAKPANAAQEENVAVQVSTAGAAGDIISFKVGHLLPNTLHYIAVRAIDGCNQKSDFAVTEVKTTEIVFATVSPCFVATAAYGSDMAKEVNTLRQFRNNNLMHNAAGRFFVKSYYAISPKPAAFIADKPMLRAISRALLTPFVEIAKWADKDAKE